MRLIEAVGGLPGEMRIAHQQGPPIGRSRLPEGPSVAAELEVVAKIDGKLRHFGGRRRRRRSGDHLPDPAARPALQHLLFVQAQKVVEGCGRDPPSVSAGDGALVRRGVAKIPIVARYISRNEVGIVRGKQLGGGAQSRNIHGRAEEGVALDIGNLGEGHQRDAVGTERLGPLASQSDQMVGQKT